MPPHSKSDSFLTDVANYALGAGETLEADSFFDHLFDFNELPGGPILTLIPPNPVIPRA